MSAGRPVLAVAIDDASRRAHWTRALARALPECEVACRDAIDPARVDFVFAWRASTGAFRRFTRLRGVLSLGAGVDAIVADRELPPDVPVVRMVDDGLTQGMREYVLLHVLRHHRAQPRLEAAQRAGVWASEAVPLARERGVGVMGLGVLGGDCARHLAALGFRVSGWSRSPRTIEGVHCLHGADALDDLLSCSEILVCLLPLTPATANILDRRLFGRLPRGACLVNAGRGEHLVERDLLDALSSGQLAAATLDAFRVEPLPAGHPFWRHHAITLTPHNASVTRVESGAHAAARAVRALLAGRLPPGTVDRERGY